MLPAIFLSGFIFPIRSMPVVAAGHHLRSCPPATSCDPARHHPQGRGPRALLRSRVALPRRSTPSSSLALAYAAAVAAGGLSVHVALARRSSRSSCSSGRTSKMIPVIFVAPLVQLLALGFAANIDVTESRCCSSTRTAAAASRALVERFTGSGYFELVGGRGRRRDGRAAGWSTGRAQLALVIAPGYGAAARAGRAPAGAGDRRRHRRELGDGRASATRRASSRERGARAARARAAPARRAATGAARRPHRAACRASATTPTSRAAGSTCPPCWPWS